MEMTMVLWGGERDGEIVTMYLHEYPPCFYVPPTSLWKSLLDNLPGADRPLPRIKYSRTGQLDRVGNMIYQVERET
jgi:hypothetical protein